MTTWLNMSRHYWAWIFGGLCAFVAFVVSCYSMHMHLKYNRNPECRKHVVRILFMVPIYAVEAWLGLVAKNYSEYWDVLRETYEALVIYSFYMFLVGYLGGFERVKLIARSLKPDDHDDEIAGTGRSSDIYVPPSVEAKDNQTQLRAEESKQPAHEAPDSYQSPSRRSQSNADDDDDDNNNSETIRLSNVLDSSSQRSSSVSSSSSLSEGPVFHHMFPFRCCFSDAVSTDRFLYLCQLGTLQYVPIKLFTAITTFILAACDKYTNGKFEVDDGYPYMAFITNASQIWAMYALFWFYHSFQKPLAPCKPLPKALCIKGVVFFTFWQSVLIAGLSHFHTIKRSDDFTVEEISAALQDFIICIEMLIFSILHVYYFSHRDFADGPDLSDFQDPDRVGPDSMFNRFVSFISPTDLAQDTRQVLIEPVIEKTKTAIDKVTGKSRSKTKKKKKKNKNKTESIGDNPNTDPDYDDIEYGIESDLASPTSPSSSSL